MKSLVFICLLITSPLFAYKVWTDPTTNIAWKYDIAGDYVRIYGNIRRYEVPGSSGGTVTKAEITTAIPETTEGDIVIPDRIENLPVKIIMSYAFHKCSKVTSVKIPDSVTSIGSYAFWGCSALQAVNLPDVLQGIGEQAFYRCISLSSISIPRGVTNFPYICFYSCTSLKSITIHAETYTVGTSAFYQVSPEYFSAPYVDSHISKTMTFITIPDGITSIRDNAFEGCTSVREVVIPEGVTTLGSAAFSGCTNLNKISLAESLESFSFNSRFQSCANIREVYAYGKPFVLDSSALKNTTLYYTPKYAKEWETYLETIAANYQPNKTICMGNRVSVVPTFHQGGTFTFKEKICDWESTVSISAKEKEGYIFLGWSSDMEAVEGVNPSLSFTMPKRDVILVPNFFPKALVLEMVTSTLDDEALSQKIDERINAKIDGETLLTKEQAESKTQEAIDKKVTNGDLLPKEEVPGKVQEAIDEKLANKELVSADAIKEMALGAPMIEVKEGKAKVGIELQKATELGSGTWEKVKGDEATISEDGTVHLTVPADEKAAFYKFVVPVK